MTLLKHVDLCSGIGGFSLGFRMAQLSNPILFCDIEPWCRKILTQHWPDVPIYEDVKEIANDPERFIPERPDILTAGYPCQPFSVAGRRRGEKDHRHIWPEIFSIIQSRRPTWTVFENVRGHITMGLDSVLADLEREGYSTRTFIVPAIGVDAPHKRDRVWIVSRNSEEIGMAHTEGNVSDGIRREADQESDRGNARMESECSRDRQLVSRPTSTMANTESQQGSSSNNRGEPREVSQSEQIQSGGSGGWSDVANTDGTRSSSRVPGSISGQERNSGEFDHESDQCTRGARQGLWPIEPNVARVADGIPNRVDRIKGLGNAIVPQIAYRIGLCIKEAETN